MIDWQRVHDLRNEIGEDDFSEVVEMFLEEADEGIKRLEAGVPQDSLEDEYHSLKGSGLNLGLQDFAARCAQAEQLAARGDFDQIDTAGACAAYKASRAAFLEGLGKTAA